MCDTVDIVIKQGSTFSQVLRWEAAPIVYAAISAITQTAPARVTATAHGIPDGWRVAVVSVRGMPQINAANKPPRSIDYTTATVVDANTIELNEINAADFSAYTSGGYLQHNTPVDLAGYSARMMIKDRIGGTVLASYTSVDAIAINNTNKTITTTISATDTALFDFSAAVYSLELQSGAGVVTELVSGNVTLNLEVTA